jgi:hypothetical protein
VVEEYHKAVKTGCGVERHRSRPALAAVGIASVLAARDR